MGAVKNAAHDELELRRAIEDGEAACTLCDSTEFLQGSFGNGGLNDVCRPCFFIWYDGVGPCNRPEHGDQKPHVHGDDIRAFNLKAKAEGTWPFDSPEFGGKGYRLVGAK